MGSSFFKNTIGGRLFDSTPLANTTLGGYAMQAGGDKNPVTTTPYYQGRTPTLADAASGYVQPIPRSQPVPQTATQQPYSTSLYGASPYGATSRSAKAYDGWSF